MVKKGMIQKYWQIFVAYGRPYQYSSVNNAFRTTVNKID